MTLADAVAAAGPDRRLSATARTARSSTIRDLLRLSEQPHMLSMAGGLPATELLPVARLTAAAADVFDRHGARALQYGPTEGVAELRELVAAPLCSRADEVMVTTGSQQGLALSLAALAGPGDVVVTEAPSYLGALQAAAATGASVAALPGDGDGLDVELLADRLAAGLRPKACYVVTDFANPTGATLSPARRRALAALAERAGFVIIEDNPYGELRFRGETPEALRALAPQQVVSLRTVSKVLAPGLRVGWLAAPPWLFGALVRAKQSADLHTANLNQLVVADVLADSSFMAAQLAALRRHYAERQEALRAALDAEFGPALRVAPCDGGMFLWVALLDPSLPDSEALLARALEEGTAFVPGTAFLPTEGAGWGSLGARWLRLCYATLAPRDLGRAVERLARAARWRR